MNVINRIPLPRDTAGGMLPIAGGYMHTRVYTVKFGLVLAAGTYVGARDHIAHERDVTRER